MSFPPATENPFELSKASNFSVTEVLDYWVDIMEDKGGLMSVLQPKQITPMMLLGGKGSGKTHLLRYCSAPVQAARHQNKLTEAIQREGFIGIYVPTEALNPHRFAEKGQSAAAWADIFAMYFELWLVTALLETVIDHAIDEIDNASQAALASEIANLFDEDVSNNFRTLTDGLEYLVRVRKNIDVVVNNSSLRGNLDGLTVPFSHGKLIYGVPQALEKLLDFMPGKTVVYLIDEAENLTVDQQRFLNTLIRYRKGNATIRVGARLYGIRTNEILGSGEPNKLDAEYHQVILDEFLRDQEEEYTKLIKGLVSTRLRRLNRAPRGQEALDSYFVSLSREEEWRQAMLELARKYDADDRERPYFKRLRKHIEAAFPGDVDLSDAIVQHLRADEDPIVEKTSIFMLYRRWPSQRANLLNLAKNIEQKAGAYRSGDRRGEMAKTLLYFRSDLIAQFYRDCRQRVPFAGLKTLTELSQGIPRNFLTILKYIYRRSFFANEAPFDGGVISVTSQSNGVRDSSAWFWEDAQPDGDGEDVREAIEALALLFRSVRFSDRPAECDLCTFSVDTETLSLRSRKILKLAENWSYLIQVREGARNKNDRGVSQKYQLGPMLAPQWDISEHRRGNIELRPDLANAIFDKDSRDLLPGLVRARVAGMRAESFASGGKGDQDELFQP
ncbi:ORC-CDC6 family AAA ATPase [Sphingopyxis sp. MWB1]|uniref:ORC-CDC6 family AAA ATPase n=1 Tax=Sphingopyxis sp. MWB1 TaxID=1537715 RepID=UPI00051A3270